MVICGLLAGVVPRASNAVAADAEAICRAVTDRFIQEWCGASTNEAFKEVLKDNWYKPDEVGQIVRQTEAQRQRSETFVKEEGKRLAPPFEFLGSRQMGESHMKLVYVEKLERTMIPWSFLFYRAENAWRLVGILKGEGAKEDLMAMDREEGLDADKPRQLADAFVKGLSVGEEEAAFDGLVGKYWARQDEAAEVKQRIAGLYRSRRALGQLTLGKPVPGGYELLSTRSIGKSLVRIVCLQKYEYGVMPIKMIFYRPQAEWTLYELTFGEGVSKEDMASATAVHLAK